MTFFNLGWIWGEFTIQKYCYVANSMGKLGWLFRRFDGLSLEMKLIFG